MWDRPGGRWLRVAVVGALLVAGSQSRRAHALPASVDADGDGFTDAVELFLGSNYADPTSTPESVAVPATCLDGMDNDGDGASDLADPGCSAPAPSDVTFPGPGRDVFDSGISLDGYPLATPLGVCPVDFDARGPTVVERGPTTDLGGGLREFPIEIVALQLTGTASILAAPGCAIPPGDYPVTMFEDPTQASRGMVTDTNPDPATDFPAASFFDVFFVVDTPLGLIPGGPPGGPPGQPVRVNNTVACIPPYQGGRNPSCYQVQGLTHEHCPKAPPQHYKCYTGKFPRFQKRSVTLADQFTTATSRREARVLRPLFFCNPAAKDAEPLYDDTNHLECYQIRGEKTERTVLVRNQFGDETVSTKKPALLCLPSQKDTLPPPVAADHYKCYRGKFPRFTPRTVTLIDQFGSEQTQVLKPLFLCNPVSKNGEPIENPREHLKCYKTSSRRVQGRTVSVQNQFGQKSVRIRASRMLCVPSAKFEATTTTTTTQPGTTTTTLPTGGLELIVGYRHPTPGVPPSLVCGKITGPPNASVGVTVTGPGVIGTGMLTVMLNASGMGTFQVQIGAFGPYNVEATLGTQSVMRSVNVVSQQSTCPS